MKRNDHVLIRATVFDVPDPDEDEPQHRFYTFEIEPVASTESGREFVSVYERDVDKVIFNAGRNDASAYPVGTVVATADTVYIKDGGSPSGEPTLPWREATAGSMFVNISSDEGVSDLLVSGEATVLRVGTGE